MTLDDDLRALAEKALPCPTRCTSTMHTRTCAAWRRPAVEAALSEWGERRRHDMEQRKDAAYLERNRVVAALAKCFPSGTARTAIEGWSDYWHGCVYIDLPTGQVSWHYHDSQAHLFEDLPPYTKSWDGHDTDEKYRRVAALEVGATRASIAAAARRWAEGQRDDGFGMGRSSVLLDFAHAIEEGTE